MMNKEHIATAKGMNLGISRKFAVEIGRFIKRKKVSKVKTLLEGVIEIKVAVPFTKYHFDLGHKKGSIGPGRFPVSAAKEILYLVKSAEMNAINKNFDMENVYVSNVLVGMGNTTHRAGRLRGRLAKKTHVEIILEEKEVKKEDKKKVQKKWLKENLSQRK